MLTLWGLKEKNSHFVSTKLDIINYGKNLSCKKTHFKKVYHYCKRFLGKKLPWCAKATLTL